MTCDSVLKLVALYSYGELTPDEEDRVEQHLHECTACAKEMTRQRRLAAALDSRKAEVPAFLLDECRADLMAAVEGGAPRVLRPDRTPKGPWTLFLEAVGATFGGMARLRQPAGALALIAVGFLAARFTGMGTPATPGAPAATQAGFTPTDDVFATVRSVQPDSTGHVKIAYDETRRREVIGKMDDQAILRLMLAAAHEDNAAVRVESVELLKNRAASSEVRDALLNVVAHDANPGVRLKALDGLKGLADDPQVRKTLSAVLLTDDNPAVRLQVVDLLVAHHDDAVVGVLQGMVQKEDNNSVRMKVEKALKEMNASVGVF
jgi:hypothetical protein